MMASRGPVRLDSDRRQRRSRIASWAAVCGTIAVGTSAVPALASAATVRPVVSTADIAGLGTVLVTGNHPLYVTTNDARGHSTCTGPCAGVWIPLVVSFKSARHLGHLRGLGTVRRAGGRRQMAIDGRPLYFLRSDHTLADASGQGFANVWFTVHPNGSVARVVVAGPAPTVTAPPASTTSPPPVSTPTSGSRSVPPSTLPPAGPSPTSTQPTSPPPPTTSPPSTTTTTSPPSGGGVSF